jgi:hypothetical protein
MGLPSTGQLHIERIRIGEDAVGRVMIYSDRQRQFPQENSMWTRFVDENGAPALVGSEGGSVIVDDEHGLGARITLEKDGAIAPFAITCGIYGWMVHTRFFSSLDEAMRAYEAMKPELATILEAIPPTSDPEVDEKSARVSKAISDFVDRFP